MARAPSPPSPSSPEPTLDAAMAERLRRAAGAARELSDVLWEALHEELGERSGAGPRAQHVTDLAERLVDVAATLSALATAGERIPASAESEMAAAPAAVSTPEVPGQLAHEPRFERTSPDSSSVAIIVDERDDPPITANPIVTDAESEMRSRSRVETSRSRVEMSRHPLETSQPDAEMSRPHARVKPRPLPWDTPLSEELRATRSAQRPASVAPEAEAFSPTWRRP